MKKSYVFSILLVLVQAASGQEGFIRAYNFGYPTAVRFNAMLLVEDTIITCGYIIDSLPPYQTGVFFSKIDTFGQVQEIKVYYDSTGNHYVPGDNPGGLIKLQDNSGYLFVGNMLQGSGGFLMKFDLEGNKLWIKVLEDLVSLQGYYYRLLENENGILISGIKQQMSGQLDIFLIKTDKQGSLLWEKSYGLPSRGDYLNSLLKLNDNEYILAGHTGPNQDAFNYQQWHYQIQIFAVDSLGNEKWRWESDPPFDQDGEADMSCRGLHRDEAGNWIYMTTRGEHFISPIGTYQHTKIQAQFVVRDSNFNVIVERDYDDFDGISDAFLNMIHLSDGDWLGVGVNYGKVNIPGQPIAHDYAWMNRISNGQDGFTNLGDSLWTRKDLTFPDSNFQMGQYLHSAVELPSGNIIVAGYFTAFGNHPDHGLLIKVNQHGCIDWDTCTPTNFPNTSLTNTPAFHPDLKVFPNPTRHQLHILSDAVPVWDKVEVVDITGRVVKTVFNNNGFTMEQLPAGVYVLRLWKEGRYWTRRVVRQ
jgi:Secretion system C-terminal sorting domain